MTETSHTGTRSPEPRGRRDRSEYPTSKAFIEGGYEVVFSMLVPKGGDMLVEKAVQLLNELKPDRLPDR